LRREVGAFVDFGLGNFTGGTSQLNLLETRQEKGEGSAVMDLKKKRFYPLPTVLFRFPSVQSSWSLSITFVLNRLLSSMPLRLKSAAEKLTFVIRLKAIYVRFLLQDTLEIYLVCWYSPIET
jgi:hypothetical protein